MTKMLITVSVMQLVEKDQISLGDDLSDVVPYPKDMEVLKGFHDDGKLILEKNTKAITLRWQRRHRDLV
jgi:CubicO group peptidase (beta-lactamase class C family)